MLAGFLESLSVDVAEFGEQVCLDLSAGFLKNGLPEQIFLADI